MENSLNYQPVADRYERMPYKYCGKSGLQLPLISLGLWHNFGSVDNFEVATDMIKFALIMESLILIWQTITVLFPEVRNPISAGFCERTFKATGMK